MFLPLLKCFLECILFDGTKLPCRIFINLFNVLETMSFQCFPMWGIEKNLAGSKSVLHEVFFSICISKHVLTDADLVLLLPVSQQMRGEFCTDAVHLKFSLKITLQDPTLMPISSETFSDCQTMISTNHLMNSLNMAVVCWCGSSSRPGVFTDWRSTLFETHKPLV